MTTATTIAENITIHYGTDVLDRAREWCGENKGDNYTDADLMEAAQEIAAIDRAADADEVR